MNYKVRITVAKKLVNDDLIDDPAGRKPCPRFEIGQKFVASKEMPWEMPPGFCGWAWADIQKIVYGMARGGPAKFVTCCTDGWHPVIFKLERIVDQ